MSNCAAWAQTTVFRDDFNNRYDSSRELNPLKWNVFGEDLAYARTQFGNQPTIAADSDGVSFARLKLSTFNSTRNRLYPIRGSEMTSPIFTREGGKEFEARVRSANHDAGIVSAFWTFGEQGEWGTTAYKKDEIDFEFLSNGPRDTTLFTTWNDWNPRAGYSYNDGIHHNEHSASVAGLNWDEWNTYKIRWLSDRTEWFINGVLVRTSAAALPDDAMAVRFNIWAPDSSWPAAYSASLAPATDASANVDYFLDVDWVEVRAIGQSTPPPTVPSNLGAVGGDSRVNLSWDAGAGATSYIVKRSLNAGGPYTVVTSTATATTYVDTAVTNGNRYYYVVAAANAGGQSADSDAAFATPQPALAAPTSLVATGSIGQISLNWTDNAGGESGFKIERSLNGTSGWKQIATAGANATNYSNISLNAGTTYFYRVRCYISGFANSTYSNIASATTSSSSGTEIIVDNAAASGVILSGAWTAGNSTTGFYGSNYLHDGNAGKGTKSVRFTPNIATAGNYAVYGRWCAASSRASNVPFDITSNSGTAMVTVNQRLNGGSWVLLGTYSFSVGTSGSVLIRTTGTNGFVIADAVRFVPTN